jgi:aryl-alcohol dehydrogenase-like predicted oxidoreductase
MKDSSIHMSRRTFIQTLFALTAALAWRPHQVLGQGPVVIKHAIPSTGEFLPVIGLGTSRTFDVGPDPAEKARLAEVLQLFFDNAGAVVDSSPMYGAAEAVVGELLKKTRNKEAFFAATKVWTDGRQAGIEQMQKSMHLLGVKVMDLMQIHNLRDWQTHLPVLRDWKQQGKIRYLGITTSHGRFHEELAQIMRTEALDFVQFSYNLEDREAEERLLPLAADHGIATLINRPFKRGELFAKVKGKPLPEWSGEFDCHSWSQFFLKFIIAHPSVTCVIPATSKVQHMKDNMGAGCKSVAKNDPILRIALMPASF